MITTTLPDNTTISNTNVPMPVCSIIGEFNKDSEIENEYYGNSVSLNGDGKIVVIGVPKTGAEITLNNSIIFPNKKKEVWLEYINCLEMNGNNLVMI